MATKTPDRVEVTATVQALRLQLDATVQEMATLDAAPVPCAEAETALGGAVDRLAALYQPDAILESFTRPGGDDLGTVQALVPDARYDPQRAAAYQAAINREALLTVLRVRLRALYAADPARSRVAVSMAERLARLAQLRERLRALELQEELAIVEAMRHGVRIDRRADADPAVIFATEVIAAESVA